MSENRAKVWEDDAESGQEKLAAGPSVRSKLAGKLPTTLVPAPLLCRRPLLTDTGRGTRRPHWREIDSSSLSPAEARALEDLGPASETGARASTPPYLVSARCCWQKNWIQPVCRVMMMSHEPN